MSAPESEKRFAIIGVGGFVAPRHLRAIKEVGGELVAALDPKDSVGVIDSFFPDARFFVEFERFDRHVDKLRRSGKHINYVSICSPNYLHDAHTRFALRSGANVICEKPLVLNPWNIDGLADISKTMGVSVNTILQLRLHPTIRELKQRISDGPDDAIYDVELTYITSRGRWYDVSWKGDEGKSGGIATNIGVHFFDMLVHVFGSVRENIVHCYGPRCAAGMLVLDRARVRWFLSIDRDDLPAATPEGKTTYRSIRVDGEEIEFSDGFTDLHTLSYQAILRGEGFDLDDVRPSIEIVSEIRRADCVPSNSDAHPFLQDLN